MCRPRRPPGTVGELIFIKSQFSKAVPPPLHLVRCGVEKLSTGTEGGKGMNRFPGLGASALGNNPVTAKACKVSLGRILAPLLFAQPCGWCDVVGVEGERAQLLGEQTGASNFPVQSPPLPPNTHTRAFVPSKMRCPLDFSAAPSSAPTFKVP